MKIGNNGCQLVDVSYHSERFHFDMNVLGTISGDSNANLRQEMMQIMTGDKIPKSKCGAMAVSTTLKAYYEQPQLF